MSPVRIAFATLIATSFLAAGCGGESIESDPDSGQVARMDAGQTNPDAAETPDAGFSPIDSGVEIPDSGAPICSDTWTSYAQSFMRSNCTRCHSAFSNYGSVSADRSRIRANVSSGIMPRGGFLSAQERARFLSWIDCGLPM